MEIVQPQSAEDILRAQELFEEYAAWVGNSLCFQDFDKELKGLPGRYAPPDGRLLLAFEENQLAGCIALRKIGEGTCEMKRLFVRSAFRGRGLGRTLAQAIIEEACQIGYEQMRLNTIPGRMSEAFALYRSLGFSEIEPYYVAAIEGTTFMGLVLRDRQAVSLPLHSRSRANAKTPR